MEAKKENPPRIPSVGDVFTCRQIRSCCYDYGWEPLKIPAKLRDKVNEEDFQKLVVYTGDPMVVCPYDRFWGV